MHSGAVLSISCDEEAGILLICDFMDAHPEAFSHHCWRARDFSHITYRGICSWLVCIWEITFPFRRNRHNILKVLRFFSVAAFHKGSRRNQDKSFGSFYALSLQPFLLRPLEHPADCVVNRGDKLLLPKRGMEGKGPVVLRWVNSTYKFSLLFEERFLNAELALAGDSFQRVNLLIDLRSGFVERLLLPVAELEGLLGLLARVVNLMEDIVDLIEHAFDRVVPFRNVAAEEERVERSFRLLYFPFRLCRECGLRHLAGQKRQACGCSNCQPLHERIETHSANLASGVYKTFAVSN